MFAVAYGFSLHTSVVQAPSLAYSSPVFSGLQSTPLALRSCRPLLYAQDSDDTVEVLDEEVAVDEAESETEEEPKSRFSIKEKLFPNDGLTFKQRLAKSGLSVLISYGWLSTSSSAIAWSVAWYIHCKRTLLSPLVKGQWKPFLAVYAGFWVFNSVIRPLRFTLALSLSRFFEGFIQKTQERLNVSRKMAVGTTMLLFNVLGTGTFFVVGISIASFLSGVPVF